MPEEGALLLGILRADATRTQIPRTHSKFQFQILNSATSGW